MKKSNFEARETKEQYLIRHLEMDLGLRESPEVYANRHAQMEAEKAQNIQRIQQLQHLKTLLALQEQQDRMKSQSSMPYLASDGNVYMKKESPLDFKIRKLRNALKASA